MGILGLAFEGAAMGTMVKGAQMDNPIEALVSHMSNVGNPTTRGPGGMGN